MRIENKSLLVLLVAAAGAMSSIAEAQVQRINTLTAVPDLIDTGRPTPTTFIANIEPNPDLIAESVRLIEVDAKGRRVRVVGRMFDDGTNGDHIKSDNNYTLLTTISELLPVSLQYRATARYRRKLLRTRSAVSIVTVAAPSFAKPANPGLLVTDDDGTYPVDQLIVTIVENTPLRVVQTLAASVGGVIVGYSSSLNAYQLEFRTTNVSELNAVIAALMRRSIVIDVLKNSHSSADMAVNNDLTQLKAATPANTAAYDKMRTIEGFQSLIDFNTEFAPVRVGVIDTGVLETHEEFTGVDLHTFGGPLRSPHGTMIAGIIGANNSEAFGMYPGGQMNGLLAGVTSSANASGSKVVYAVDSVKQSGLMDQLAAIDTLAARGVRVINMSFGAFQRGGLSTRCTFQLGYVPLFPRAIEDFSRQFIKLFRAHKNILFVIAAGNSNIDAANDSPANINEPNAITIGATDLFDRRSIWDPAVRDSAGVIENCAKASDFGPGVDLAAPGTMVYAPTGDPEKWRFWDGTSVAAPLVSGTAAMLLAINPGLSPESLIEILKKSADPITTDQPIGGLRLNFNAATTLAAYTAVDLYPVPVTESQALGSSSGRQAGFLGPIVSGAVRPLHAALWSGTAQSVVDLHPTRFDSSLATGIAGGEQVGTGRLPNSSHALLWRGSANSVVDLHPGAFLTSIANGTDGAHQVGSGVPANEEFDHFHALLWTGNAASVVDLHPAGFDSSSANAVAGNEQVGIGGGLAPATRALLWKGSARSVTDLHPREFIGSNARGTDGAQQVGYGNLPGNVVHALLWTGSADSVVDLHPEGFVNSQANGVAGGHQVGNGLPNGSVLSPGLPAPQHALLWNGSAASVVDLHKALPPGFTISVAYGIDSAGNVAGVAAGPATDFLFHAFLWKRRQTP